MDRLRVYNALIKIMLCVLEDDPDFRMMFEERLKQRVFTDYIFVSSVDEFLSKLNGDIHILVIDHFLGAKTGLEVMEEMLKANRYCYVIVVTGQHDIDIAAEYVNRGAWKYINKTGKTYMQILDEVMGFFDLALKEIMSEVEFFSNINIQLEAAKRHLQSTVQSLSNDTNGDNGGADIS